MSISESHKQIYSKTYRNHTNSSFKKLTDIEKKQSNMLSTIHRLKNKAKVLKDLRFITNEIKSNCAYHTKNIEDEFKKMEHLNIPKSEKECLIQAWELKRKIGESLIKDFMELIKYVESCNNS